MFIKRKILRNNGKKYKETRKADWQFEQAKVKWQCILDQIRKTD